MADYACWRLKPWGYHLTNMGWHAMASVLTAVLVAGMTAAASAGWLAGLFFAVHPVHTSAVAYIAGRADLLCTTLLLMACVLWQRRRLMSAAVVYLAALLSKEVALVAPALFLWTDVCADPTWRRRSWRHWCRRYAPVALVTAGYLAWRVVLFGDAAFIRLTAEPLPAISLSAVMRRWMAHWHILLMPFPLSMEHTLPAWRSLDMVAAVSATAVIAAAMGWCGRRAAGGWWAGGWLLITMVPVAQLLKPLNANVAEHWLYLPSVGWCALLALLCLGLAPRWRLWVVCGLLGLGAAGTLSANRVWRDDITLYRSLLRTAPRSARYHLNLGWAYAEQGRYPEAITHLEISALLAPQWPDAFINLGRIYMLDQRWEQAEAMFRRAAAIDAANPMLYNNWGSWYWQQHRLEEAIAMYQRAIALDPKLSYPYRNLGFMYAERGQAVQAMDALRQAAWLNPDDAEALAKLRALERLP